MQLGRANSSLPSPPARGADGLWHQAKHTFRHGVLFAIAKTAVLAAPLSAASVLSQGLYGSVEWWLSLALAIGPLAGVGAHSVIAYGTLGGRPAIHTRTATVFIILASAALVLLSTSAAALSDSWAASVIGPVALLSAVVGVQLGLSARLKGLGKGAWASCVEAAVYIALGLSLLLVVAGANFVVAFAVSLSTAWALLVIGLAYFVPLPPPARWLRRNYKGFLGIGLKFVAGSFVIALFIASPRVALGIVAEPEVVARFSLAFRWLSIALIMDRFIKTVFFRQIFGGASLRKRDQVLSLSVLLVGTLTLLTGAWLSLGSPRISGLAQPGTEDQTLLWILGAAMVLWAATASLEGCLYLLGMATSQTRAALVAIVTFGMGSVVTIVVGSDLLYGVAISWGTGFATMILYQLKALRGAGVVLPTLQLTSFVVAFVVLLIGMV